MKTFPRRSTQECVACDADMRRRNRTRTLRRVLAVQSRGVRVRITLKSFDGNGAESDSSRRSPFEGRNVVSTGEDTGESEIMNSVKQEETSLDVAERVADEETDLVSGLSGSDATAAKIVNVLNTQYPTIDWPFQTISALIAEDETTLVGYLRHVLMCSGTPADCEVCGEAKAVTMVDGEVAE